MGLRPSTHHDDASLSSLDLVAGDPWMRVAHLTSVHRRDDTRILHRQCRSLAEAGHEVALVVADGRGPGTTHGVSIIDAGRSRHRVARMCWATRRVARTALDLDADIYHLHDPELLPAGVRLKRAGRRVIFDAHEDAPRQLLAKHYLPPPIRAPIAATLAALESWALPRFDAIVVATPTIAARLERLHPRTVVINNFPILEELAGGTPPGVVREPLACYVGGLSRARGLDQMLAAIAQCRPEARLALAGPFFPASLATECTHRPGSDRTVILGVLDRSGVRQLLGRARLGLVTLHPTPNHVESQPVKLFEYMCAGLPVVASDFPLWRRIVHDAGCGLLVDPLDPAAIAAAIDRLLGDPEQAEQMGRRGRDAVEQFYNWQTEEARLLALYESL